MTLLETLRQSAHNGSPALRKVGLWIAAHPLRAIALSADEIAEQASSSQAAVNRFANHAGYNGYAELRAVLAAELQEAQEPIAKLGKTHRLAQGEHPFSSAQNGLLQAAHDLDLNVLEQVSQLMLAAPHVYTLGLGMSHYAAGFAANALMPYVRHTTHLSEGGGTEQILRRMMGLGQGDVLLAISVPRYSMDAVKLARAARERGATIIALTDQVSSPLASVADHVLLAPAQHPVISHSYVSIIAVIEELLARVMQMNPNAAAITTDLIDTVLPHLQVRQR
jgi:DNA-binding MurR/RpiR family transcriptional regulator